MDAKAAQEHKEHSKHIQQVMDHNATLLALIQEQQKKIKELMKQSKNLIEAMTKEKQAPGPTGSTIKLAREAKNDGVNNAKKWYTTTATIIFCWKQIKINILSGT